MRFRDNIIHRHFSRRIQSRGQDYFDRGRVTIVYNTAQDIVFEVEGTQDYLVAITWVMSHHQKSLRIGCDCPYAATGLDGCKHMYAALLELDNAQPIKFFLPKNEEYRLEYMQDDELEELVYRAFNSVQHDNPLGAIDVSSWDSVLHNLSGSTPIAAKSLPETQKCVLYILNLQKSNASCLVLQTCIQHIGNNGNSDPIEDLPLLKEQYISGLSHQDKSILALLQTAQNAQNAQNTYTSDYGYAFQKQPVHHVSHITKLDQPILWPTILEKIAKTERLFITRGDDTQQQKVKWCTDQNWNLQLTVQTAVDQEDHWEVCGYLISENQKKNINECDVLFAPGYILLDQSFSSLDTQGALSWAQHLLRSRILVPKEAEGELLKHLSTLPSTIIPKLPKPLQWPESQQNPLALVNFQVLSDKRLGLKFDIKFQYDKHTVDAQNHEHSKKIFDSEQKSIICRNIDIEQRLYERFLNLSQDCKNDDGLFCSLQRFPKLVTAMNAEGWVVQAQGKPLRSPHSISGRVRSGINWFEVDAEVEYDNINFDLPTLLKAQEKGMPFIELGDGTTGVLPSEWLDKYSGISEFGTQKGKSLRFQKNQAMILDALLMELPEVNVDEKFQKLRGKLQHLRGVSLKKAPQSFQGTLRPYQEQGLGWLHFLQDFGLGGCLADDMGLGKTVQILAFLESRAKEKKSPSLIVVPRSLVDNWLSEAERFTTLKCLDYSQGNRKFPEELKNSPDIIVTTYAILRRDIDLLAQKKFDCIILDEAQNIKNRDAQVTKAALLLKGETKLALSGTPIENHIDELWSLVSFINPGLFSQKDIEKLDGRNSLIAPAISPFFLRRTKDQVLLDLPKKTEQTLFCEMSTTQKKHYNQLKKHYRDSLSKKIDTVGIKRSKMHILEALLRLRQAACHPGLITGSGLTRHSGKTEEILSRISELVASKQKILVFSQFTSLLKIIQGFLDKDSIQYEYLDGRTRNRQARVDAFQNDEHCSVFLISLKAGGTGLNLTAAQHCFILDPWWNPAVEAQAIDRAHRMGQKKAVFAFRMIAKGTIEEKILELQTNKKKLANDIITENSNLIQNMTANDLQLLLS